MNRKRDRIRALLLTAVLLLGSLSGCRTVGGNDTSEPASAPAESVVSSEPVREEPKNHLTGEVLTDESVAALRPVAVMINNSKSALPQRGLAEADIIYELPVEGSVTRLMAVYSDYRSLPDVGSVRSARHDYVELAEALNAFYVHIGKSTQAQQKLDETGIDHLDGTRYTNVSFWKDEVRAQSKASEHCWFTDGANIQNGIDTLGIDMSTDAQTPLFRFGSEADFAALNGETLQPAVSVTAPISSGVTATFTYDEASGSYRKGEYGAAQIDENTGEAVAVRNVFLMYTDVVTMSDGLHKDVDLSSGTGYYISGGVAREVTFLRESETSPIRVLADGEEVPVHPGNSWFCVIPNGYADDLTLQ